MEAEREIFDALPSTSLRPAPNIDIFELFAGASKFTLRAGKFQLNALQPLDWIHGSDQDLHDPQLQREVAATIKRFKPWVLIMGLDCRLWSIFNENLNYSQRRHLLRQLRTQEKKLVMFACELAILQYNAGRFFLIENPQRSRLWVLREIVELLNMPQTWLVSLDTGAFGAAVEDKPILKPMNFLGNIPFLDEVLGQRLSWEDRQLCTPIQGTMTKKSQEYPDSLVDLILKYVKKAIQHREPSRFAQFNVLAVAQPIADLTVWNDVVDQVSRQFERSSKRPYNIAPGSDLGKKICDLMRMDACRIQCAFTPTTRRIPQNLIFEEDITHRAALLQFVDGTRSVEVDNMEEVQQRKQRFEKPVQVAVFMYGKMRTVPDLQPVADQQNAALPLADLPTDITFPNLPAGHGVSLEARRTVARLHLNLGHPSQQELMRMVAYYGGAPANVMTAIQHLKCSTCERLKSPQAPRPATMPKFVAGQFGDEIEGDIFYVRILTGEAIPVLGLVDKATGYHQAAVCQTRNASETFQIMLDCWFRPFGLPYKMILDPDTAFRGECQRQIESLGILCELCPAEAHWMIGMVERRNSVLRCVLEKLVDHFAAFTAEQLGQLLAPALHAINSSTFTRGRTAFQAVFGRIPRLPGGVLTDPSTLASSPTTLDPEDNLMAKGEIIRSEAQKYLIDLNVSQQFRRAILRRTRNTKYQDLTPGQTCAFWRWSKKGQRKRGAWTIAKFLSWDPSSPTKLAWLRTGNTTVLVSAEQLRGAMGYENWCPSKDDIAALKDASKSFMEHLVEDETGPAAPDETFADDFNFDQQPTITAPPTPLPLPSPTTPAQPAQQPLLQPSPLSVPPTTDQPQLPANTTTTQTMQQQTTNLHMSSPTYKQTNIYQRFGTPPKPSMLQQRQPATPRSNTRSRQRSRSPLPAALRQAHTTVPEQASSTHRSTAAQQVSQQAAQPGVDPQPAEAPVGEDTSTRTVAQIAEQAVAQQQHTMPDEPETPYLAPPQQPGSEQQSQPQEEFIQPPNQDPIPDTSVYSSSHEVETTGILPGVNERPDGGVVSISSGSQPSMPQGTTMQADNEPPTVLPQKRAFETLFSIHNDEGNLTHQQPLTDGSPDLGYGKPSNAYFKVYANSKQRQEDLANIDKDGYETDTTIDSDEDDSSTTSKPTSSDEGPDQPRMTRQELKQLDRELPWREIWKMPPAYVQKFLAAIEKEANSWSEWNSIRPLTEDEIQRVKADPALKKRILRSRAAYRDKNRNQGEVKAKCRIVALGHEDPDIFDITRSSPTPGRATEHILYLIAVSGMNCEFNNTNHAWRAWIGDVQTAFLQGQQQGRKLPLYLRRPNDPLIAMTPYWKTELYEVTGNIYGLPSAPFQWIQEVDARLIALNYQKHDFDRMLYYLMNERNEVISLVMVYVDDFFGVHREDHDPAPLFDKFRWGEKAYFEEGISRTFKGKELTFTKNEKGRFVLKITMDKFLETVEKYRMPRGRLQQDDVLSPAEQREFRSIAGCLQWLGSQARPDVSPAISLCNHGLKTTISDLRNLAETLDYAKETANQGMIIQDVPLNKDSILLTYTDASWANAAHSSSQLGILVMITTPDAVAMKSKAAILDWRSTRSPRVCRSTLAAEACAADEGSDRSDYLNLMLSELFYNQPSHLVGCRLNRLHATDAKSLYDALISINPNVSEKRVLVNIRAIQQCVSPQQTRWVPTDEMYADGLTKMSSTLRQKLLSWLQCTEVKLVDSDDPKKES